MGNLNSKNVEFDEETVDKTEERLAALNFSDLPVQEPEPDDPTPDPDPKSEPEPESEPEPDPEAEPEADPESTADDQDDSDEGSKDKEDPPEAKIPEGYIRAAKRQGWSDVDIADEIKANPERAERLFRNAYETTNKLTRDYAAIGREKAETTRREATEKAAAEAPEIKDYITVDEIAKISDGDEATAVALKNFNTALKSRDAELAELRKPGPSVDDINFAKTDQIASTVRARAAADEADVMRINQFFGAENMKLYNDFYGTIKENQDIGDLTPNQRSHRFEVLQVADQLMVGRKSQGFEVTALEALEDAHLLVTESIREKVITDGIRSSLKKRSKGRTLRPSDSKKTSAGTELKHAKNRTEAIANAEARLSQIKFT